MFALKLSITSDTLPVDEATTMAGDEYNAAPSTGRLKIKGVADGRVDKKKKKKKPKLEDEVTNPAPSKDNQAGDVVDSSVVLATLEEEDQQIRKESRRKIGIVDGKQVGPGAGVEEDDIRERLKTEAEKKFDDQRRKRLEERLKREGVKTHKQRVEELNKYLSGLSEHHDMPRIGPG